MSASNDSPCSPVLVPLDPDHPPKVVIEPPTGADHRVLIAGIGGASLGTELAKCLRLAGGYKVFGCDISPLAYGHYDENFDGTDTFEPAQYTEQLIAACYRRGVRTVIPGGEGSASLLNSAIDEFHSAGITLAVSDRGTVDTCSDKGAFFAALGAKGVPIPWTIRVGTAYELPEIPGFPCVVKPAKGTGGSRFVSLAPDRQALQEHVNVSLPRTGDLVIQEYIPSSGGEYTVGVLRIPRAEYCGSLAIQRQFDAKLSVLEKTGLGLLSSGYSQGYVAEFAEVRCQAEAIASAIGAVGPINIQGRVRDGVFLPFEANPRFSASVYLRALAGFNEPDLFLRYLLDEVKPQAPSIRGGYYLRSLCEMFVPTESVRM